MHSFKDSEGREWLLEINVTSLKRVKALTGINLMGGVEESFAAVGKIMEDMLTLYDVLYALCQEQCEKRGVSEGDFGRAMSGDALDEGGRKFAEGWIDFFPDQKARKSLRKALASSLRAAEIVQEKMALKVDGINPEALAGKIMEQLESKSKASNGTATSSPAPSASTPGPSPSAS